MKTSPPSMSKAPKKPKAVKAMYVVSNMITKGTVLGREITMITEDGMCGMLPVFRTRREAKKFSPKSHIFEIVHATATTL